MLLSQGDQIFIWRATTLQNERLRVATVGKVIEFKQDGGNFALSPTMALIKPDIGSSAYLTQYLKSKQFNDQLASNVTGTTRTSLGIQLLRKLKVRLPVCEREANAIANILDTLDTKIRQTEAIIAKLQQVKQGLLHDLLTRGIDANGQLRPPRDQAPELYKESPLGWIPRSWEVTQLGSVVDVIDPNPSHRYPDEVEQGVPICSTENFEGEDEFCLARAKKYRRVFITNNLKDVVSPLPMSFSHGKAELEWREGMVRKKKYTAIQLWS